MNSPKPNIKSLPLDASRGASIGSILLESGKLNADNVETVLQLQWQQNIRFGEAARSLGLIDEEDVLQVVARQFGHPCLRDGESRLAPELVAAHRPSSPQSEAVRAIRGELLQRWFSRGKKALAVAAVNPGDGASLFAANLALSFAQLGRNTLLVDANLRRPRQHRLFGLDGGLGLSDQLAGRTGMPVIRPVQGFAELSVLPAGTEAPNPQELVSRPQFGELRDDLAQRFETIVFDMPAFAGGADAAAIATAVGGALLVARRHHTRIADIGIVRAHLARNGVEVVGAVLLEF